MRYPAIVLAVVFAGCLAPPGPPQYMNDAVRGGEDQRRALDRILRELGPGFDTCVVDDLFFIASNGGANSIRAAERTVRQVMDELYDVYFTRRPTRPVRVYCFRDSASYTEYVRSAYGRAPSTPYGFYMASERKMVLNLGTGRGTLAHELVHPLLGEDFPGVPAWFNEGFASLFEFTKDTNGRMLGMHNWRLRDLKRSIRERREVPLRTLMGTTTEEFYGDDRGVHYAMARYFCLYLQTNNLLIRYYQEFRASAGADSTGIAALERVTRKSFDDFEKEWRSWIRELP
ncbi:MAG TPA: hypothetical protein VJU16_09440 [Planctomycetota bacterium]|nr:hypothetical protein [Planctomycetota bacterium]